MDQWGLGQVWKDNQRFSGLDLQQGARGACRMGNRNLGGEIGDILDTVRKPGIQERMGPERPQGWREQLLVQG